VGRQEGGGAMIQAWRDAFWTAAFLRDLVAGEKRTLFKRFGGEPVVTRHVAQPGGRRPVSFDRYLVPTPDGADRPALVVTHGFTHEGARDPRLQALCRRLARLGWAVVVPEFPQMRQYRLGLDDTDDLETVILALERMSGIVTPCGILAFSFGAAPVLIALTREAVRRRTAFALVFGGCFDLRHATRYVLTGAYDLAGLSGAVLTPTERDDRWKFLKGNTHLLPDSPTRVEFVRALDARIADPACRVDPSAFSEAERAFFALVANRDPARFEALFAPVEPMMARWIRTLSPKGVAARITTPLVIVHSRTDQKTHYSESVALSRAAPGTALLAIVNTFAHVEVSLRWSSPVTLFRDLLPGLRRMWAVARALDPRRLSASAAPASPCRSRGPVRPGHAHPATGRGI
jgi:dienelactone hydrolase